MTALFLFITRYVKKNDKKTSCFNDLFISLLKKVYERGAFFPGGDGMLVEKEPLRNTKTLFRWRGLKFFHPLKVPISKKKNTLINTEIIFNNNEDDCK